MPTIRLFFNDPNRVLPLGEFDEALITKHSKTVRDALQTVNANQPVKDVYLEGASAGPLKYVLTEIKNRGSDIYLNMTGNPLDRCVAIYQAIEVLQVEPDQLQRTHGHIVQHIAHNPLTPADVKATWTVFESRTNSKVYRTLIHHLAFDFVGGRYSTKEATALQNAASPALSTAVDARMEELEESRANTAASKAKKDDQKRSKEINRRVREFKEQEEYEESEGLRPASEETIRRAINERPGFTVVEPKRGKKGKNAAGGSN